LRTGSRAWPTGAALNLAKKATNALTPAGFRRTPIVQTLSLIRRPDVAPNEGEASVVEHSWDALQTVAHQHGWEIEQQGEKYYLRSLEEVTFRGDPSERGATGPTNHLAFFRSLAEIHRFLTGE
jgi:hypothetical protein